MSDFLVGTRIVRVKSMMDTAGNLGKYFCFHDLAIRRTGKFRLLYQLIDITEFLSHDTPNKPDGHIADTKESLYSGIFEVYPPKDFPGIVKSQITLQALYEI